MILALKGLINVVLSFPHFCLHADSEYIRASGGIVSITNLLDYSSRVLIPGEVMVCFPSYCHMYLFLLFNGAIDIELIAHKAFYFFSFKLKSPPTPAPLHRVMNFCFHL